MTQDSRVAVIGLGLRRPARWRSPSSRRASTSRASTSRRQRVAELNARRSPIDDISDERLGAALDGSFRVVDPGGRPARRGRRHLRLRADADQRHEGPGPRPGPRGGRVHPRPPPRAGSSSSSSRRPSRARRPARSARSSRPAGLRAGVDFDLAFAPERVNPGDPASAARAVPRLVGGIDAGGDRRGPRRCSRDINDRVVELSSPDAAELAKLLENVFRNVNIAFVNQLALLCERMGLDVWEVIDAAATKPFGFMRFTPGPGVGGHCIPVDPYYLSWRAREFDFIDRFIELAGDINLAMPRHVVDLVAEALNDRGRALKGAQVGDRRRGVQARRAGRPQLAGGGRHRRARASAAPTSASTTRTSRRSATRTARATTPSTSTTLLGLGRCHRRRHRPPGDRLGDGLSIGRPRRRHRELVAGPRRPGATGPAPRRRLVGRRLT